MPNDLELRLKILADEVQALKALNNVKGGVEGVGEEAEKTAGKTDGLVGALKGVAVAAVAKQLFDAASAARMSIRPAPR